MFEHACPSRQPSPPWSTMASRFLHSQLGRFLLVAIFLCTWTAWCAAATVDIKYRTTNGTDTIYANEANVFSVWITGTSPTGTVRLTNLGTGVVLGEKAVPSNSVVVDFPLTFAGSGSYNLRADYLGDANNTPGTSSSIYTVLPTLLDPVVTHCPIPSRINIGQFIVICDVKVSGPAPTSPAPTGHYGLKSWTPTGLLWNWSDQNPLSGNLTFNWQARLLGVYRLDVDYSGDTNYKRWQRTYLINVEPWDSVTTLRAPTELVFVGKPAGIGRTVQGSDFSITTWNGTVPTITTYRPTGSTTIFEAGAPLDSSLLTQVHSVTFSTPGVHQLTAAYGGDVYNKPSVAAPISVTVLTAQPSSVSAYATPPSVAVGQTIALSAAVSGVVTPTGKVRFKVGTVLLGEAFLDALGIATLQTSMPNVGTYAVTAEYLGDFGNLASTGAMSLLVSQRDSAVDLTGSVATSFQLQPITLSATVRGTQPSGTITFKDGSTVLGTSPLASGKAQLTVNLAANGVRGITAEYAGDGNHLASTSAALAVFVKAGPAPTDSATPVARFEHTADGLPARTILAPDVPGFGFITSQQHDALRRPRTLTDAAAGVITYDHQADDALGKVTDPRNLATTYQRNGLGDIQQLASPDTGTAVLTYDEAGNLKTRRDSRGALSTFGYDALNRLTSAVHTLAGATTTNYTWVYDQTGPEFGTGTGRLTTTTFPGGSQRLTYDALGRVTRSQVSMGTTTMTVGYAHDLVGRPTRITYPSGRVLNIERVGGLPAALSLAAHATATPVPLVSGLTHEPFGAVHGWNWHLGDGSIQVHERLFDTHGRMVRYRLGNVLRDVRYDEADRIAAYKHLEAASGLATAASTALDQSFGYDAVGRLTLAVVGTSTSAFSYDATGNRKSVTLNGVTRNYTVPPSSNWLTGLSNPARGITYDKAGNAMAGVGSNTGVSHVYLPENRLGQIQTNFAGTMIPTATYRYDADGRRVQKACISGICVSTNFVYDVQGHLLGEYALNGAAIREYVWLGDTPVAAFENDPAAPAGPPLVYYLHADHLDTPRVVVNRANNALRWRWLSEPFGTALPETNPSGAGTFTFNLRFPGQYADKETGLFYNHHRDYDAGVGRYAQSDPIGLAGGINTYSYVGGNPVSRIDPTGQIALADDLIIGGTVLAVGCAIAPACRQAVGDAISGLGNLIFAKPFVNDPQAQAEHDEYKRRYNEPPPPFRDPCDELQWRLKREEDLLRARQAWDAKWLPGRHAGMSGEIQSQNAIKRIKDKMKQQGCDCP